MLLSCLLFLFELYSIDINVYLNILYNNENGTWECVLETINRSKKKRQHKATKRSSTQCKIPHPVAGFGWPLKKTCVSSAKMGFKLNQWLLISTRLKDPQNTVDLMFHMWYLFAIQLLQLLSRFKEEKLRERNSATVIKIGICLSSLLTQICDNGQSIDEDVRIRVFVLRFLFVTFVSKTFI